MTWYDLRDEVEPFLGERATMLFAHAISAETDCLICSTFFRRLLIDAGEDPDAPGARRPRGGGRRVRPAARARRQRGCPTSCSPGRRRRSRAGADRGPDGVRRADGRDERLQQRPAVDLDEYLWPYRRAGRASGESRRAHEASSRPGRSRSSRARRTARAGDGAGAGPRGRCTSRRSTWPGRSPTRLRHGHPARPGPPGGRVRGGAGVDCLTFAADVRDDAAVSRRGGGDRRALRPDRHPVQQRRDLRLRPGPRADRGRLGRDARHQSQGGLDRGPAGHPAHDRPASRA